ncbi:MAG: hypothetical protein M3Y72_09730 [Acidobacteriota bacterium]|nr:hypothetical protein [Acidobacteriota bacterium]
MKRASVRQGATSVAAASSLPVHAWAAGSKFKFGVISDEISQDFDHGCYVINKQYGLHGLELREILGKNLRVSTDVR